MYQRTHKSDKLSTWMSPAVLTIFVIGSVLSITTFFTLTNIEQHDMAAEFAERLRETIQNHNFEGIPSVTQALGCQTLRAAVQWN